MSVRVYHPKKPLVSGKNPLEGPLYTMLAGTVVLNLAYFSLNLHQDNRHTSISSLVMGIIKILSQPMSFYFRRLESISLTKACTVQ